ncbi:hypothetical protein AAZV13_19G063500 [Glycine max]
MVVLSFSQRHCHGWSWCSKPSFCHGKPWMGSWCGDSCVVMDNHTLHTVANGGDA